MPEVSQGREDVLRQQKGRIKKKSGGGTEDAQELSKGDGVTLEKTAELGGALRLRSGGAAISGFDWNVCRFIVKVPIRRVG